MTHDSTQKIKHRYYTALIITIIFTLSGCFGSKTLNKSTDVAQAPAAYDSSSFSPDNCTKCHIEWAERFDYISGWDRYGYIFDKDIIGFYDPWSRPEVENRFQNYYATDWWESPELYVWPEDIAQKVESLSVLSRNNGLPKIPHRIEEIEGHFLVVDWGNGDFTGIQKAVDKALPGTTVFVRPGVYNEVITLKDGINLIGEDPNTTIINPLNKGHAVSAANHSIISGFTLTGTGIDYETGNFNCAVYVSGCDSTCIIANNIFRENGLFGVWVDGTVDRNKNKKFNARFSSSEKEIYDRPYKDFYPNPIIVGNTFYRIGQRGVFLVHAGGEIFNNIFTGNVKAIGLEKHSKPLIHHNIVYFNNVSMAVNHSEPIICYNILLKNQWGQRMLRGANPIIFNNVTYDSPHFRDFDEEGLPITYNPVPGTGERQLNPKFVDPLNGDFNFYKSSPLRGETIGFNSAGIMHDPDIPQPFTVKCKNSLGREVLALTGDIISLIKKIDAENEKIRTLEAAYTIKYESYINIVTGERKTPVNYTLTSPGQPALRIEYDVAKWIMRGDKRFKQYDEKRIAGNKITGDSGEIIYNRSYLEADGGRFSDIYKAEPDPLFIGERPFREAPGSFYRDYDQFVKGAIGPAGTFYNGYMRIMGGKIEDETFEVDGHECVAVRYPHIGKDQYFLFYLDPEIGYRPRKMVHYYNEFPYRVIDSYRYKTFPGEINVPVYVRVTDLAVTGPHRGRKVAVWELTVSENILKVNN